MTSMNDIFETAQELVDDISAKFADLKEQQTETKENK